jgi:hypothetical protein
MTNNVTREVSFEVAGKPYTLLFNCNALCKLESSGSASWKSASL